MRFSEADIHRAFDEDEFFPCFQPLVELRTGQLSGFEILARWNHGKLGGIPPDIFIPFVEKSGLINRLTRRILDKAFAVSPTFPKASTLAVNLSSIQLVDPGLPARIKEAADLGGFSLSRLIIEITESALVDDLARAQAVAHDLKEMGCRLALDDFGTGYSSLRHLQALPFDKLKVDRSFVSTMTHSRESRKIVAAVLGLGHSLGVTTVAEGVETEEQANMLLWLGCDMGQGWLFGRPVPAGEIPGAVAMLPRTNSAFLPSPFDTNSMMSLEALPAQRLAQLQAIYDGVPVGLCFLDRNMRYVSLNRRLAEMNGAPIARHIGRTPEEIIPDFFPLIVPYIRRALSGVAVTGLELQKPSTNPHEAGGTVLLSYQPVRDEAGDVLGVSVAVVDISERKSAEEALRREKEHYRHMVELNPHTPWVLDAEGKVIEASSRWHSLTGMTMADAMGDGWMNALHPDDVEATEAAIKSTLRTGDPIDVEYRIKAPNGSWKWMWARGSAVKGPRGEVVRVYGSVEDVEQPKTVAQALDRCRAGLQATFDAVPMGMILADAPEGNIVMANREAHRMFLDRIRPGQKMADYGEWAAMQPDGQRLTPEGYPLATAILAGRSTRAQIAVCQQNDGRIATVALSAAPIYGRKNEIVAGVMVVEELEPAKGES